MSKIHKIAKFLSKNKSNIFTGITCGSSVVTVIEVHKNTCIANGVTDEDIKQTWYNYIPAAIACGLTIGSSIANRASSASEIANLIGSATMSSKLLSEYKKKVIEVTDQETYEEIERRIARDHQDHVIFVNPQEIDFYNPISNHTNEMLHGDTLFFDQFSKTWFRSSIEAVQLAINFFNRYFVVEGCVNYNLLLEFLGLDPIEKLYNYGYGFSIREWDVYWLDYCLIKDVRDDGEEYYIITFDVVPYHLNDADY